MRKNKKNTTLSLNQRFKELNEKFTSITDNRLPQKSIDLIHETNAILQDFYDHIQPLLSNPFAPQTKTIMLALSVLISTCLMFILDIVSLISASWFGVTFTINLNTALSDLISISTLVCLIFFYINYRNDLTVLELKTNVILNNLKIMLDKMSGLNISTIKSNFSDVFIELQRLADNLKHLKVLEDSDNSTDDRKSKIDAISKPFFKQAEIMIKDGEVLNCLGNNINNGLELISKKFNHLRIAYQYLLIPIATITVLANIYMTHKNVIDPFIARMK